ncbi:MAG: paaG1, partial [Aeromicrobium sp.]|nr:paaG1 [Aeromicrobium sp.]
ELQDRALALAQKLAQGPTLAYGRMRRLLRESWTNTLSEQLLAETDGVTASGATADSQDAIAAFIEKRRPEFTGR